MPPIVTVWVHSLSLSWIMPPAISRSEVVQRSLMTNVQESWKGETVKTHMCSHLRTCHPLWVQPQRLKKRMDVIRSSHPSRPNYLSTLTTHLKHQPMHTQYYIHMSSWFSAWSTRCSTSLMTTWQLFARTRLVIVSWNLLRSWWIWHYWSWKK